MRYLMLVAALYDIHGNLPALEAVLDDLCTVTVDRIIVGGDVLPGPMPHETLRRLQQLDLPISFLYGNGEIAVLDQLAGRQPRVPEQYLPGIRWNAGQLSEDERLEIASWPATVRISIPDLGDVLFCHATPRNENEIFTRLTPDDTLLRIFENTNASVVVCGHTHMQFDRMLGNLRVINAGSVGMPFGEPGADWLLLGSQIELRHTNYDSAGAADRIRGTGYPFADDFANNSILQPPSEAKMMEIFTRAQMT